MKTTVRSLLSAVAACSLLVAHSGAQQVLTVGAGQPFATIPAAIAAASPGDTILVQPGTYGGFTATKGVRIVGHNALITGGGVLGAAVLVQGVPAGESFALVGFGLTSTGDCVVVDCRGQVALRDLHQIGALWGLQVRNSEQVHAAASTLRSARITDSNVVLEGCAFDPSLLWAVEITGGTTLLESCSVRGSLGVIPGPGVALNNGTLAATRSTISGTGANSAIVTVAGQILLDPSVTLVPGPGIAPIAGPVVPGTLEFASQRAGTDGAQLSIQGQGPAGGVFGMVVSLPGSQTATPIGVAWLEPSSASVLYFDVWAPDRSNVHTIPHPPLPPGLMVTLQALYFPPSGLALGTPSVVVVP